MATTNMRIVIRRDDSAAWTANGTVVTLLSGEQGYEVDTGKLKIGDGLANWNTLPYFAGGITNYDNLTLITDASGVLMLNEESVIGNLGSASTVKEYVDLKDAALVSSIEAESAARIAADSALGDRIDALTVASDNGDTALAAQLADSIEAVNDQRASSDSALQLQISSNLNAINANVAGISGLDTQITNNKNESQSADEALFNNLLDSVAALVSADTVESAARIAGDDSVAAMLADSVAALEAAGQWLYADQAAFPSAADNHGRVVHSHAAGAEFFAHSGAWLQLANDSDLQDSVTALEAADAAEVLSRIAGDDSVAVMLGDSVTALEAADAGNFVELSDSIIALRDGVAGRALTDMLDVEGTPTANDLLIYDGSKWVPYPLESHADDAAAATAGFDVGDLYRGGSNRLRVRMT